MDNLSHNSRKSFSEHNYSLRSDGSREVNDNHQIYDFGAVRFAKKQNILNSKKKTKRSLREEAYNKIIHLIYNGEIKSAEVVSHRTLAQHLSMSKQPIGEALRLLEAEGVVESLPRIGTKVCSVTPEEMWGMLQWRIALECRTAALATEWITDSQKKFLIQAAIELDEELNLVLEQRLSREKIRQKDSDFHILIAECSGCQRLVRELRMLNIYDLKVMICETLEPIRGDFTKKPVTHLQLAKSIVEGKEGQAMKLMQKHIEKSYDMANFTKWFKARTIR
ncbi:MAG: GntR family transcriptional regulator [Victivallaceae bacterium]|nr:GntR family transcriptional regulator [Victivallaceae bacterium]